jgi:hypothetical protein
MFTRNYGGVVYLVVSSLPAQLWVLRSNPASFDFLCMLAGRFIIAVRECLFGRKKNIFLLGLTNAKSADLQLFKREDGSPGGGVVYLRQIVSF